MQNLKPILIVITLIGAGVLLAPSAQAQVPPVLVAPIAVYASGWNMVGGPPGTDFSGAAGLDAYASGGYYTPSSSTATLCQGYWAEFLTQRALSLPINTESTVTCALQPGWNLMGNPFSSPATLPSGTTGLYWNTASGTYQTVSAIPIGASVWIYAPSSSSIVLQNSSQPAPVPVTNPTITLFSAFNPGPYTVHVGDTIELQLNLVTPVRATADPQYLHLVSAGTMGQLTCAGDPACEYNANNFFWLWQAIAPGTTTIDVAPECRYAGNPCDSPDQVIAVNIQP